MNIYDGNIPVNTRQNSTTQNKYKTEQDRTGQDKALREKDRDNIFIFVIKMNIFQFFIVIL
jgi:hypothetical protein